MTSPGLVIPPVVLVPSKSPKVVTLPPSVALQLHGVHQRDVQLVDRHVAAERTRVADVATVVAGLGAVAEADVLAHSTFTATPCLR